MPRALQSGLLLPITETQQSGLLLAITGTHDPSVKVSAVRAITAGRDVQATGAGLQLREQDFAARHGPQIQWHDEQRSGLACQ